MFLRAPLLFLVIGSLALPAASQMLSPQSTRRAGALGTVTGSVRTADGKPIADARVELRDGMTGSVAASGYTNYGGTFEFQNIAGGNYEVVVSSGLDEARDRVSVQNDVANVNLRLGQLASDNTSRKDGTISVAQLKVPEKARDENKKAREAMQKHDVAGAWKHVNKALQITPQFAAALTTRALLELDDNKSDSAIADLEQAVKLDAGYGLSFLVLGAAYNQRLHFDDAIRALDHGVALMPNYWQGYFELGKSYLGKNDLPPREGATRPLRAAGSSRLRSAAPGASEPRLGDERLPGSHDGIGSVPGSRPEQPECRPGAQSAGAGESVPREEVASSEQNAVGAIAKRENAAQLERHFFFDSLLTTSPPALPLALREPAEWFRTSGLRCRGPSGSLPNGRGET
jgi:Putative Zn-dependent protease, contains TPR repeats